MSNLNFFTLSNLRHIILTGTKNRCVGHPTIQDDGFVRP